MYHTKGQHGLLDHITNVILEQFCPLIYVSFFHLKRLFSSTYGMPCCSQSEHRTLSVTIQLCAHESLTKHMALSHRKLCLQFLHLKNKDHTCSAFHRQVFCD
jgi:hypothetical protein